MSAPDPVQTAFDSWESDVKQTNDLYDQLQSQKDRLEELLALMGQVPASVAFNMLIPAAMLMVSNQNTSDMEIQASQGNEEADVLTLINITQADDNYLASNSGAYQDYQNALMYQQATSPPNNTVYNSPSAAGQSPNGQSYYLVKNPDGSSDPIIYDKSTGKPVTDPTTGQPLTQQSNNAYINDPDNQAAAQEYEDTYAEAQEAQTDLKNIFLDNDPTTNKDGSQYEGWCDENYASSMLAAYKSWQSATDDLSAQGTDDPAGQSDEYYYSLHEQEYAEDPASSPYATDITNLTTSLNTEQSANNSMQSQIQGIIKVLMSEAEQYEGSTKSAGKSVIEEKNYWVQQQKSS